MQPNIIKKKKTPKLFTWSMVPTQAEHRWMRPGLDISQIFYLPTFQNYAYTGLDTYFFPNLAVGQPSNNMDLSEIEIYLGIMMILSFFVFVMKKKQIGENFDHLYVSFFLKIAVSEARQHIINHLCFCLEVVLFIPVHFDVNGSRTTFQRIKKMI